MKSEFDDAKLNEVYGCKILCDRSTASFRDQLSDDCGYALTGRSEDKCITDLMVYIKYRTEHQFKESSNLLNEACSSQKRAQHQSKTGNKTARLYFLEPIH